MTRKKNMANLYRGTCKFSDKQVRLLREAYEHKERPAYMTHRYLAKVHNVHHTVISRLLTYKTYTDV